MQTSVALLSMLAACATSMPLSPSKQLAARDPPLSDGVSVLDTINQYRTAYGLNTLNWDNQLQANAAQTGADNGGETERHEIFPPTQYQVIAPGPVSDIPGTPFPDGLTPFGITYVAGWLCEVPTDPQVSDQCGPANDIMHFVYADTGHHDFLTNPDVHNIGCAFTANPNADPNNPQWQGLWVCDLN